MMAPDQGSTQRFRMKVRTFQQKVLDPGSRYRFQMKIPQKKFEMKLAVLVKVPGIVSDARSSKSKDESTACLQSQS